MTSMDDTFDNGLKAHEQAVLDAKYEEMMAMVKKKDGVLYNDLRRRELPLNTNCKSVSNKANSGYLKSSSHK